MLAACTWPIRPEPISPIFTLSVISLLLSVGRSVEVDGGAGANRFGGRLGDADSHESVAWRAEVDAGSGGEPDERVDFGTECAFEPVDELVVGRAGRTDSGLGRGHRSVLV